MATWQTVSRNMDIKYSGINLEHKLHYELAVVVTCYAVDYSLISWPGSSVCSTVAYCAAYSHYYNSCYSFSLSTINILSCSSVQLIEWANSRVCLLSSRGDQTMFEPGTTSRTGAQTTRAHSHTDSRGREARPRRAADSRNDVQVSDTGSCLNETATAIPQYSTC